MWSDHGWHLGEYGIWGKHCLFEEALRSPLIVSYPGIKQPGKATTAVVETVDIFPTLCDLAGLPVPDFAKGVSLKPVLANPAAAGHPAFSYWGGSKSVRTPTHRMILHRDGYAELYDHGPAAKEPKNLAEANPEVVKELTGLIEKRF